MYILKHVLVFSTRAVGLLSYYREYTVLHQTQAWHVWKF